MYEIEKKPKQQQKKIRTESKYICCFGSLNSIINYLMSYIKLRASLFQFQT